MAFFSKITGKKPAQGGSGAKPRARSTTTIGQGISARELAAQHAAKAKARAPRVEPMGAEVSVTGASLLELAPVRPSFEVAPANTGLSAGLENATLLHASGQTAQARTLLEESVRSDDETRASPLAWLALFDLMQRAGDKAAFDKLALEYVVRFERSAPAWEARVKPVAAPRVAGGSLIAVSGKLTGAASAPLEGLKRAIANRVPEARVDLMGVTGLDDAGAHGLADLLAAARHARVALRMQRGERLKPLLDAAVAQGRDGGEGAWLLALELLQWENDREAFEDRAVEFAVTFERSPPSWEPPPAAPAEPEIAAAEEARAVAGGEDGESVHWSGVMAGPLVPQLGQLSEFALARNVVPINMTDVERIDFVCAGALLNAIGRVESQQKSVQIYGASPIIRAMLLLIGISPRHFVKKPQ